MRSFVVVALLFAIAFSVVDGQGCITNTTYPYRLPSSVIPSHYSLSLTLSDPNEGALSYKGAVGISVTVTTSTTCVVLSSHLLNFSANAITYQTASGQNLVANKVAFDEDKQQATIFFNSPLSVGDGVLSISQFQGVINSEAATGFFLSDNSFQPSPMDDMQVRSLALKWHKKVSKETPAFSALVEEILAATPSSENEEKSHNKEKTRAMQQGGLKMYATQFEVSYARRAFPCFDDPGLKATFNATIAVPSGKNLTVLFNTPQQSNSTSGGQQIFVFGTTPHRMANYLVAFAIGNFDYVEKVDNGVPFRIYTPPGASQYGKFALDVSVKVTKFFGDLWNVPYSKMMPKMDQIAVPAIDEDAMENWGLLTYASSFLLVDNTPGHFTLPQIQLIALVTTHEIAHQWFGDTVTMPWWNECYLNEGFARFLQYVGVDFLFPEWYIWTHGGDNSFFNFAYEPVMAADRFGDAVPVITSLKQANGNVDADQQFGCTGIAYGKGAALNRYVSTYAGETVWNKALSLELNNHLWSNPTEDDLVASFDAAGMQDMSTKFLPWLFQSGYPVVSLSVDTNSNVLTLTQTPISKYLPNKNSTWWIYLPIRGTSNSGQGTFQLNTEFQTPTFSTQLPSGDWLVEANYNFTAYVGIAYGEQWPAVIGRVLSADYKPTVDRQLLLQSLFYLTTMSHEQLSSLLQFYDAFSPILADYLTNGTPSQQADALYIYPIITSQILSIVEVVKTEPYIFQQLGNHLTANLLSDAISVLPWTNNDGLNDVRSSVYFWAVYFGLNTPKQPVVDQALALAQEGDKMPEDIKSAVYLAVAMYNGSYGYIRLVGIYEEVKDDSPDKAKLLMALSNTPSVDSCVTTLKILPPSKRLGFAGLMLRFNAVCRDVAWEAYAHESEILWKEQGSSATPTIVSGMKDALYTPQDYSQVVALFQRNRQYITDDVAQSVLNRILINNDFVNANN